jgi:predicted secreted protein
MLMPERVFGIEDSGTDATLDRGSAFVIRLSEQSASSGYRWQTPVFDESLLVLERERVLPGEGGPGSASRREFLFRALAAGAGTIGTQCRRNWERESEPASRFDLRVRIVSSGI